MFLDYIFTFLKVIVVLTTPIIGTKVLDKISHHEAITKRPATLVPMFSCKYSRSNECIYTCRTTGYTHAWCRIPTACLCYNGKKETLRQSHSGHVPTEVNAIRHSPEPGGNQQEDCNINTDERLFVIESSVQRQECVDAGFITTKPEQNYVQNFNNEETVIARPINPNVFVRLKTPSEVTSIAPTNVDIESEVITPINDLKLAFTVTSVRNSHPLLQNVATILKKIKIFVDPS